MTTSRIVPNNSLIIQGAKVIIAFSNVVIIIANDVAVKYVNVNETHLELIQAFQ
jgi:hypothetical protein